MMTLYSLVVDIPNGEVIAPKTPTSYGVRGPGMELTHTIGGITNFFSVLITSFGYTPEQSLLYGTPGGAIEVVTIVSWGFATLRWPNVRILTSALSLALALLGIILIIALESNVGRLIG